MGVTIGDDLIFFEGDGVNNHFHLFDYLHQFRFHEGIINEIPFFFSNQDTCIVEGIQMIGKVAHRYSQFRLELGNILFRRADDFYNFQPDRVNDGFTHKSILFVRYVDKHGGILNQVKLKVKYFMN